jgi:hypothetical protein
MLHSFSDSAVVIYGTASEDDFRLLATLVSEEIEEILATD